MSLSNGARAAMMNTSSNIKVKINSSTFENFRMLNISLLSHLTDQGEYAPSPISEARTGLERL